MVKFLDGPAAGVALMLRRAPVFLRVVLSAHRTWDALDQPEDLPTRSETVFVYVLTDRPTAVHIKMARRSQSGFYAQAVYQHVRAHVPPASVRDAESWREWVESNTARLAPKWYLDWQAERARAAGGCPGETP
ncbi:MAG: hypothetical protein ACK4WH_00850 [Phycisphaerales bacterium]